MIRVRCTACGKELQGQSSRIICCGCSNMTSINEDVISANNMDLVYCYKTIRKLKNNLFFQKRIYNIKRRDAKEKLEN